MKPRVCYIRDLMGFQNFDPTSSAKIRLVIPNQAVFGVHFGCVWSDVGPHCCAYQLFRRWSLNRIPSPETNSSHLKMDGWNTIISFGDSRGWPISRGFIRCLFQGVPILTCRSVEF